MPQLNDPILADNVPPSDIFMQVSFCMALCQAPTQTVSHWSNGYYQLWHLASHIGHGE